MPLKLKLLKRDLVASGPVKAIQSTPTSPIPDPSLDSKKRSYYGLDYELLKQLKMDVPVEKTVNKASDPEEEKEYEQLRKEYAIEDKSKHASRLRTAC